MFRCKSRNTFIGKFIARCTYSISDREDTRVKDTVSLVAAKSNITEADCDSFMYAVDPEMGMPGGFTIEGGVYTLSQKPGLGLDLDF